MPDPLIEIEVAYASPERQVLFSVQVPSGSTVYQVLHRDDVRQAFPELDLAACAVGVFARVVSDPQARVLVEGERVEIYRPLLADPKEIRRLRAAKAAQGRVKKG